MSAYALNAQLLELSEANDRRFRRLLAALLLPVLAGGMAIPFVKIAIEQAAPSEPVLRRIRLLPKPIAAPAEPQTAVSAPKATRPQLTPEEKLARAQEKVSRFKRSFDQLAALRDMNLPAAPQTLVRDIIASDTGAPALAVAEATSGGIGETDVVERSASTGIGRLSTTAVQSPVGAGGGGSGAAQGGSRRTATRTLEEIQLVFDRSKGALYTMYQRERRSNPSMVGKLLVRLTIAPSGRVTACKVIASELHNPDFERSIVARILLMDFGAKDVGELTLDYPILFLPV